MSNVYCIFQGLIGQNNLDSFRFSATKAMWLLSPFHPIRRIALTVFTHPMFSFAIITTILVNCKVMTIAESE